MKNGNVAVTADDNGKAHIWRANMSKLFDFRIHDEPVRALSFSPDDKKFASGGDDGLVRLYDFWSGTMEVELKGALKAVGSDLDGCPCLVMDQLDL